MPRPNTGPRLKLNRSGIYEIAWSEGRRSRTVSTRTANLQEAQKALAGFLTEMQIDKERGARMTVADVIDYYDKNHIETGVVDKKRQRKALSYISAIIGDDSFMDELAGDDFVKYRKRRQLMKTRGVPTNGSTIRRELNTFLAACNFAVRNRKLENRHVPLVELPDHNPSRERWLERTEAQTLLKAAQPESASRLTREYRFIAIALSAPKRRQAIEGLMWTKVDLKNRVIDFRKPGEPETKKRRGRAPISDWLLPILERAYEEKTSLYVLDRPGSITKGFRKVAKRAKMPEVTPHTCRHTWGTWAAQGGASMWQIAAMMGCTVATAERNYLHHSPEHLRAVADKVSPEVANAVAPVEEAPENSQHNAQH